MGFIVLFVFLLFQSPFLFENISEAEGVRYTVFRSKVMYFEELQNPDKEEQQ